MPAPPARSSTSYRDSALGVFHVPPPLPPPRYIADELRETGVDPGWTWGSANGSRDNGFRGNAHAAIRPGSSLLSGADQRLPTRDSPSDTDSLDHSDDDPNGKPRQAASTHRFTSERQLGRGLLETSSHAYDKQLLSKIGGPNTPNTPHTPTHGQLKPLSLPDRLQQPPLESPATRWPPSGAASPAYSGFRSPAFDPASTDAHPRRFGSISTPGLDDASSLHHGSYDHSIFTPDSEFGVEETGMRELHIRDRSPAGSDECHQGPKGGRKRRASSPPSEAARDDRPMGGSGSHSDLYHRRSMQMLVGRNVPPAASTTRCPPLPESAAPASLSSSSSLSQRTASFASSFGFSAASSLTSYNGDHRHSPNALSPSTEADLGPVSPYAASRSLNPSPRASISRTHHQRGLSENEHSHMHSARKMSTDGILHSRQGSIVARTGGAYICECCPKKPKKFDSEEELRLHELEKQYTCQFCPNRFKNKNEAERHQNSLHLRRHSWSCAALAGVHAAFHPSPTHSAVADVCGYCGEEFPLPPNWDARAEHLNQVHKSGECNQAKKFFRADHFRQHLKHSHAGTSGKWTNMLETACMKDEPVPKERVGPVGSIVGPSSAPLAPKPGTINEVHEES